MLRQLKAHDRATLIGSNTFGKDTIQLIFDLEDGSSLHVTAAQWWIPSMDTPLEGVGLQPDLSVEAPEGEGPDPFIRAAANLLLGTGTP